MGWEGHYRGPKAARYVLAGSDWGSAPPDAEQHRRQSQVESSFPLWVKEHLLLRGDDPPDAAGSFRA